MLFSPVPTNASVDITTIWFRLPDLCSAQSSTTIAVATLVKLPTCRFCRSSWPCNTWPVCESTITNAEAKAELTLPAHRRIAASATRIRYEIFTMDLRTQDVNQRRCVRNREDDDSVKSYSSSENDRRKTGYDNDWSRTIVAAPDWSARHSGLGSRSGSSKRVRLHCADRNASLCLVRWRGVCRTCPGPGCHPPCRIHKRPHLAGHRSHARAAPETNGRRRTDQRNSARADFHRQLRGSSRRPTSK